MGTEMLSLCCGISAWTWAAGTLSWDWGQLDAFCLQQLGCSVCPLLPYALGHCWSDFRLGSQAAFCWGCLVRLGEKNFFAFELQNIILCLKPRLCGALILHENESEINYSSLIKKLGCIQVRKWTAPLLLEVSLTRLSKMQTANGVCRGESMRLFWKSSTSRNANGMRPTACAWKYGVQFWCVLQTHKSQLAARVNCWKPKALPPCHYHPIIALQLPSLRCCPSAPTGSHWGAAGTAACSFLVYCLNASCLSNFPRVLIL